jgi:hypothetical protein
MPAPHDSMAILQPTAGPSAGVYMYELDPSTSSGTHSTPYALV